MLNSKNYEVDYYYYINPKYAINELNCIIACRIMDLPKKYENLHTRKDLCKTKYISIKLKT